jgi:hypothetical protein
MEWIQANAQTNATRNREPGARKPRFRHCQNWKLNIGLNYSPVPAYRHSYFTAATAGLHIGEVVPNFVAFLYEQQNHATLKDLSISLADTILIRGVTHMTIAQIEDEIRSLRPSERIELYRWLDYMVVDDCGMETSFCSRLGVDRSLEIRHAIVSNCGDYHQKHPENERSRIP